MRFFSVKYCIPFISQQAFVEVLNFDSIFAEKISVVIKFFNFFFHFWNHFILLLEITDLCFASISKLNYFGVRSKINNFSTGKFNLTKKIKTKSKIYFIGTRINFLNVFSGLTMQILDQATK